MLRPQVFVQGMSPKEWETIVASGNADVVTIDGCWPLPPRGGESS
jgi:hypothetical protein